MKHLSKKNKNTLLLREITVRPVGLVHTTRREPIDDNWGNLVSSIQLDGEQFEESAVAGLSEFSHIDVIFLLHQVSPEDIITTGKQPRGRKDWPVVGIFAQRAKDRPNRIAVSCCRLLKVEKLQLTVQGLDAIDGSPVLDIKPHFKESGFCADVRQPAWVDELMRHYYD